MNKPYSLGILIGRFQNLHKGHEQMIDKALELCENVGIFVGSSNESMTNKNPYSFETRKEILKTVYGDKISVYPLPDIGVGNNSKWGDYVIKNIIDRFGVMPDLFVSGKEERRAEWFDSEKSKTVAELLIPKTIDISASKIREFLLNDDLENWKKYTNEKLYDKYEELKKQVLLSADIKETTSM